MSYCTRGKISSHSELCRPRYGQFTNTGQIAPLVQNLINFRSLSVRQFLYPNLCKPFDLVLAIYGFWYLPKNCSYMSYCTLWKISGHSELYRPRYGQFTKVGQIAPLVQNLVNFSSGSFGTWTCASYLT